MKARKLQIDVKKIHEDKGNLVEFNLIVDGTNYICLMQKESYEAMMQNGIFIRDGKEKDSAGILNTTRVFEERVQ